MLYRMNYLSYLVNRKNNPIEIPVKLNLKIQFQLFIETIQILFRLKSCFYYQEQIYKGKRGINQFKILKPLILFLV